jgi:carbon storage regulator
LSRSWEEKRARATVQLALSGTEGSSEMLVLSRRKEEAIVMDGRIVVTVLSIKGKTVRLGIDAPREVAVHRKELADRIGSEVPLVPMAKARDAPLPLCQ